MQCPVVSVEDTLHLHIWSMVNNGHRHEKGHRWAAAPYPIGACRWQEVPVTLLQKETSGRNLNQNKYPLPPHRMSSAYHILRTHSFWSSTDVDSTEITSLQPQILLFHHLQFNLDWTSMTIWVQKQNSDISDLLPHFSLTRLILPSSLNRNTQHQNTVKTVRINLNYPSHCMLGTDLPSPLVRLVPWKWVPSTKCLNRDDAGRVNCSSSCQSCQHLPLGQLRITVSTVPASSLLVKLAQPTIQSWKSRAWPIFFPMN